MNDIWQTVNQAFNLKLAVLVGVACIAFGYFLRTIKKFPNALIPAVVMIAGGVVSIFLQPEGPKELSSRAWDVKNFTAGFGVGFLAWIFHKSILKKIEDKFGIKAQTDDTSTWTKPPPTESGKLEVTQSTNDEKEKGKVP